MASQTDDVTFHFRYIGAEEPDSLLTNRERSRPRENRGSMEVSHVDQPRHAKSVRPFNPARKLPKFPLTRS
jgi:hypothetical protein